MVARVVGALAVVAGGLAGVQSPLQLDTDSGGPGQTVVASQDVGDVPCETYTVFFDGAPVGSDDGPGAERAVSFEVPDVGPDEYGVVAECSAGEEGEIVGQASFTVTEPLPTTVGPTTTTEPAGTTTTDGGTTTTEGRDEPPSTIEECEEQAADAQGQLVYEPERTMVVGRTYEVAAALSLEGLPPVTFDGSTTAVTLPDLRCTITAELSGSDFAITPESSASQSFVDTRVLEWRWDVRPRRRGDDLELTLRFQSVVVDGGREVPGPSTLHEAVIDVDAESRSLWRRLTAGVGGIVTHPVGASVATAAVLGLAAWLGRTARRGIAARRAARAGPPDQPAAGPGTPAPSP
jgi:hypothetical protein